MCMDGFGAAYAAWVKYGNSPSEIEYIGWSYGSTPPSDLIKQGDEVYICDISFEKELLLDWYDTAESIVLLDHHVSAEKKLKDLHFAYFDMNHSGAWLAWKFFHPDTEVPDMIQYIEDRDLWKWELPHSKEINAVIESYDFDFDIWDELNNNIQDNCFDVLEIGIALERYKERLIDRACTGAHSITIGKHEVMAVNCSLFPSEIGNELLSRFPDTPFSVVYSDRERSRNYSLRSEEGREDVSVIATEHGGGGHRNASGFIVKE